MTGDITNIDFVDAIVNSTNKTLLTGKGVAGKIQQVGGKGLRDACRALKGCQYGQAKVTAGFDLPCKYVIHTVAMVDAGCRETEEILKDCYTNSLRAAIDYNVRSIVFPSIGTGFNSYPADVAAKIAVRTVKDFVALNPKAFDKIIWTFVDEETKKAYDSVLDESVEGKVKKDVGEADFEIKRAKRIEFCRKYIPALQMIDGDPVLKEACHNYSDHATELAHNSLFVFIYDYFMMEAYYSDMIVYDYKELVESSIMRDYVGHPDDEALEVLTSEEIIGWITWHFRRDHFVNGLLAQSSVANGYMLRMMKAYMKKENAEWLPLLMQKR